MPSGNHKFSEGVFVSLFLFRLAPPADRRMFSAVISGLRPVKLPLLVFFPADLAIVKVSERERSAYIEDAMTNTSGFRENKKKSLLNNSEKKKETILDDEVSVAFQTAMDEFIQT